MELWESYMTKMRCRPLVSAFHSLLSSNYDSALTKPKIPLHTKESLTMVHYGEEILQSLSRQDPDDNNQIRWGDEAP